MAESLSLLFALIEKNETNYGVREGLVYQALAMAKALGYVAGIRVDPKHLDWPIVCITLPNDLGEVSWHCPAYTPPYDGYSTEEKYERARAYVSKYGGTGGRTGRDKEDSL